MPFDHSHTENEEAQGIIRIDEESLEWIFHKYFPRLVFYTNEFLGDEEKARDATTNLFVALWEQREKIEFKNEKLLQGYLYFVAKNKAIDLVRDAKKEQVLLKDLGYLGNLTPHPEDKDNALILTEAIAFIHAAIKELSPQYHSVIELVIQGKSHEEIAELLQISQASVRSNKVRAIAVLQKRLGNQALFSILLLLLGCPEMPLHNDLANIIP